jgi:hypothetical protein
MAERVFRHPAFSCRAGWAADRFDSVPGKTEFIPSPGA